jgi:DNA-binding CsgD family transcriptional regulator
MRHLKLIHRSSSKSNLLNAQRPNGVDDQPTPRELQVEDLLCRGYSQENIAAIFGRSINTISVHAMSLYRKRGVHTQVGLLLAYLERKGISVFGDEAPVGGSNNCLPLEAAQ